MKHMAVFLLVLIGLLPTVAQDTLPVMLKGYAVLPADTFAEGPDSGAATDPANGRTPPYQGQPVQGVSAVLPAENGNWLIMSDNGFGTKANSADYILRWYEVCVDWEAGSVEVVGFTQLSDPNSLVPWPITNNDTADRLLTGWDFDIESFRQLPDGTFWFGDEFGPYLLHTDATGVLLDAPIPTPFPEALQDFTRGLDFVQSPDHPDFVDLADQEARQVAANLPSSGGIEGLALNPDGTLLYTLMEGVLVDDPTRDLLLIQQFDPMTKAYTGEYWFYPLSVPGHPIGDMTAINDHEFLILERDNTQGIDTVFKRIFQVDLNDVGADGHILTKILVADLLAIDDANGLTRSTEGIIGYGSAFQMPFITIESVYPVDANLLLVVNDNNYPSSSGRRPGSPDDSEFILLGLSEPLNLSE
jgi:hypothetical protein